MAARSQRRHCRSITKETLAVTRFETLVEALDSLGWLVLLGVLERETGTLGRPRSAREEAALWAAQVAGYAIVVLAWAGYAREGMWPDFANASLWCGCWGSGSACSPSSSSGSS